MPSAVARTARRHAVVALWIGSLALLGAVTLVVWQARFSIQALRRSAQSYQVLRQLEAVQHDLLLTRAEHRSAVLDGDAASLDTYRLAERDLDRGMAELQRLTSSDPAQVARIEELQRRVEAVRDVREHTLGLRGTSLEAVRAALLAPDALEARRAVAQSSASIAAAEEALLSSLSDGERRVTTPLMASILTLLLTGTGLGAFALRDVRRAARVIAASEQRYRELADASPDGVYVVAEGNVAYANAAALELWGAPEHAIVGRGILSLLHPEDRGIVSGRIAEVMQHGVRTSPQIIRLLRADGSTREVEARGTRIDLDGRAAIQVVARDVSERRAAELALYTSEQRYRLLAENSADLISRRTLDHRFDYVSPSHTAVLGWSQQELLARQPMELIHPEDLPRVIDGAMVRVSEGGPPVTTTLRALHKDGHYVWLEGITTPILDAERRPTGYIVCARDITARRQLEQELRQAQKMEAMGRIASGVAHDFNNLLTVIRSAAELLREPDARQDELLDEVGTAVDRASGLTGQLLAFCRGQHTVPQLLAVTNVLREWRALLQRVMGERCSFELKISGTDHDEIWANQSEVSQVVLNLVVNAVDAMPGGGVVRLESDTVSLLQPRHHRHGTIAPGDYITLTVSDTGTGIEPAVLEHIFEPFYTTKPQDKGSGLGLSTVWGIVQQAQGAVVVDSVPGQGSRFTVYWPRAVAAASPAPGENLPKVSSRGRPTPGQPPRTRTQRGAGKTLLIVDDEDGIRRTLARIVRSNGYAPVCAASGADALALLVTDGRAVDAIVTDVRMPKMSGIDLVSKLIAAGVDVPVLFISGQLDAPLPGSWPKTAPRQFLAKPFTPLQLTTVLAELLCDTRDLKPLLLN